MADNRQLPALMRVPRALLSAVMIAVIIGWSLPWIGLVVTSFRPVTQATSSGWWTIFAQPGMTLDNFAAALNSQGLWRAVLNSVLITVPTVLLVVMISAMAAFALVWTDIPGRKVIYAVLVGLLVVPPEITLVPTLQILKVFGLVNTYPGVWFSHVSAIMPFAVFLLANFFAQVPRELVEAAKVDGAGILRVFFQLILPLSGSAMASLAIFGFLWVWNDLLRALVIIPDPNLLPLTATLANLGGGYGENITVMAAGAVLLMVPPLMVFLFAQRAFVRGVLAGAVKS